MVFRVLAPFSYSVFATTLRVSILQMRKLRFGEVDEFPEAFGAVVSVLTPSPVTTLGQNPPPAVGFIVAQIIILIT